MAILNTRSRIKLDDFNPVEVAKDSTKDAAASVREAANGAASAVHGAANGTSAAVRDAADSTGAAVREAADSTGAAVREASDQARERLSDIVRDVAREVGKASSDVRLDEMVARLRSAVPASKVRDVRSRIERDLPDTDKDRYDRAFERGRTQTRTMFVGLGALVGIAAGVTAALLFDPERGPARRARIAALKDDVARQAQERSKVVVGKAKAIAAERGIGAPKSDVLDEIGEIAAEGKAKAATVEREMVPVMAVDDTVESPIPPAFIEDPTPVAHG